MLTTIVVVCLFVVAFFMVLYEWATGLWVMLLIVTLGTWCVTLYQEHIKQNVKAYEKVYNLFVVLRLSTIASAVVLGAIWFLTGIFA